MSIQDDIKAAKTSAELQAVYQAQYVPIADLKAIIKDNEATRLELTNTINADLSLLNGYGDLKELRQEFYLKLGKIHKAELTT